MINVRNKISEDLQAWKDEHLKNEKDYTSSVLSSRKYKIQRLNDLNTIFYKYYAVKEFRGGTALKNLGLQKEQLERTLYKGKPIRYFIAKIGEAFRANIMMKEYKKQAELNLSQVANLTPHFAGKGVDGLQEQVRIGAKSLSTGVSTHQLTESVIMDYQMDLTKGQDGYNKSSYKIRISSGSNRSSVKVYNINLPLENLYLTPKQIYNLISERAIMIDSTTEGSKWLKLDLTDRDADGNLNKVKIINVDGFNIESALSKTSLKNQLPEGELKDLLSKIRNGNEEIISISEKGKESSYKVRVDPSMQVIVVTKINVEGSPQINKSSKRLLEIPLNKEKKASKVVKMNTV